MADEETSKPLTQHIDVEEILYACIAAIRVLLDHLVGAGEQAG
jgi:hypothetical protein